jgi:DNA binding domain, excisionase family
MGGETSDVAARDVIAAAEVAALLGVCRRAVYDAAGRGEIPHRRLGRRVLFSRSAVLDWLSCKSSPG